MTECDARRRVWKTRQAEVQADIANVERQARAIQNKLDRLDEAFLFEKSIDITTYDRHAEKLRAELTLVRINRRAGRLEELDVEGVLAFAERVLPRAADLWVQASLDQRQRFQQLFFPDGIAFDGRALLEPPQPLRRSTTCSRCRLGLKVWWTRPGSNRRPRECHSRALPTAPLARASGEPQRRMIAQGDAVVKGRGIIAC